MKWNRPIDSKTHMQVNILIPTLSADKKFVLIREVQVTTHKGSTPSFSVQDTATPLHKVFTEQTYALLFKISCTK